MLSSTWLTKEQALEKIKHFCAYQERCHSEVRSKLYTYGLKKPDLEEVIGNLIELNYLNEERFATQYAGGKFRLKQWGRKKIQYELQQKGVSSYCIKVGLKEIDEEMYMTVLRKLALAKWKTLAGQNAMVRQSKTYAYLLQKGYENVLINKVIKEINTAGNKP